MLRSRHLLEIDIFQVAYRPCRPYQEQIADFYNSGRPRFEWEKMRQKFLMEGNSAIVDVCASCGLNILAEMEGCRIRLDGLTTFVGIVAGLEPNTRLIHYSFSDDVLSRDETRTLHDEMERLSQSLSEVIWPVAQMYENGEPLPDPDGTHATLFYEFEGGDQMTVIHTNRGFNVGLSRDGLMVVDRNGQTMPERFSRMWKENASVYGETIGGRQMPFLPVDNELPAWDDSHAFAHSEIRVLELPLLEVFADVVESLTVFSSVAVTNNTGLRFSLL